MAHRSSPPSGRSRRRFTPLIATSLGVFAVVVLVALASADFASEEARVKAAAVPLTDVQTTRSSAQIGKALRDAQVQLLGAVAGQVELKPAEIADRLEVVFDALQQSTEHVPRATFDPQAIVDTVGPEPEKLLEWVTNETRLVPYQGVLRGPVGVLMDRFGNSLDRALLLAELLRRAGHEVTLARTALPKDRAATLLATARTARQSTTRDADPTQAVVDEFFEAYAQKFGRDVQALKRTTAGVRAAVEAAQRSAMDRVAAQSTALLDLIKARIPPAANDSRELEALGDHWFVRRHTENGWADMDPSGIAGARKASLPMAENVSPDDIPDELKHAVSVRVIIECACGDRLEEREVLQHSFRMTDVIGAPIALQQLPADLPGGWTPLAEADPLHEFRTKLEKATSWSSVLVVGSQTVAQRQFTMAGEVLAPGEASATGNGAAADLLGGGAEPPGRLTAEFIEFEIQAPGLPNRTLRRTLFDWIGADRRAKSSGQMPALPTSSPDRAIEAAVSTDILLLGEQLSNAFAAEQAAAALLQVRGYVLDQLRSTGKPALPDARPAEFPSSLFALALNRAAWSDRPGRIAMSEPNILTRHYGYRPDAAQTLTDWSDFDIVSNRVEALDATHAARVASRLAQGVLDTNIEVILAAGRGSATNIAELMVTGVTKDWEVTAVHGQTSLVSVKRGSAGSTGAAARDWWRVDVATGETLGMDARGWGGQAMVEYAKALRIPVTMVAGVGCMWSQAQKSSPAGRMAICAAASMLTINGFLLGGLAGQVLPMIGAMLGFGGLFIP